MRKPSLLSTFSSPRRKAVKAADNIRDRNDPATAAILYQSIIDNWGAEFSVLVQLGNALKDSGSFEKSEQAYQAALEIDPANADCHLQLGHLMKVSGKPTQAVEFYIKASLLDPGLKAAADEVNNIQNGIINVGEKVSKNPGSSIGKSSREELLHEADTARDQSDAKSAAVLYGLLIENWGEDFDILIQLGNALKDSGQYQEAEEAYKAGLEIDPNNADCHIQLGHLMKLNNKLSQARDYYQAALDIDETLYIASNELEHISSRFSNDLQGSEEESYLENQQMTKFQYEPSDSRHRSQGWNMDQRSIVVCERLLTQQRWRRK